MNLAGKGRVEKRLKVAQAGQTVDGRQLSPQEIIDMANTYNPALYAGRINIEHILGFSPNPPFNAYGDILAVEAVQENGVWCLYNTISALPNLVEMNKDGQKLYPSIEFYRDFAGTGKAYQVGLAFTDTPASLGTEPLKFSSKQGNTLFTQPIQEIFMGAEKQTLLTALAGLLPSTEPKATTPVVNLSANPTLMTTVPIANTPVSQPITLNQNPNQNDDTMVKALTVIVMSMTELSDKFSALEQKMAQQPTEPVQQLSTPVANTPVAQPAPTQTTQVQNVDAFATLTDAIQKLSQKLDSVSTQTANPAPLATGAVADVTPY
ncbi:GPO family capsid scaffolding protein [Moraxella sp. ZY210820]|uniref:GPO family capsid scaffolding protein n=1 Tax=unclassified Moraxella TaxID=2685852 RepID=UPI00272F15F3|nr:GPO family capsid scaffolding protein [Moraxella sp. ZY210820]WLF85054.1 GPO family capsid scaffolding protein [Moraxella sp. ZY210820]